MDEEEMNDKEEPSEESRGRRDRQKRMMTPTLRERQEHERTHIPCRSWCRHCVAARASNPAHRGRRFATAVGQRHETSELHLLLRGRSTAVRISKHSCVEGSRFPARVSTCGTNERGSSSVGGPTMRSRFEGRRCTVWQCRVSLAVSECRLPHETTEMLRRAQQREGARTH